MKLPNLTRMANAIDFLSRVLFGRLVTFQSLEALAFGFDVYLLTDAIETLYPSIASFHWDRLYQAGAVPTSIAQMLREWSVTSSDTSMVKKICECEIEFRTIKNCV